MRPEIPMSEKIIIDTGNVLAEVYYSFTNQKLGTRVHLVKVSLFDIGVYINSITVQPSVKNPDNPWVQMPRFYAKGKWFWPLQMEKESSLRQLIEKLALEAVANIADGMVFDVPPRFDDKPFVQKEKEFM